MLALAGKRHAKHVALRAGLHQVDRGILHRDLRAEVAIHPFHGGIAVGDRPLRHQVVDVGRPVLDGGVAATRATLDDDLDHRRVQGVRRVDGRGAALDVVDEAVLVADDQGPLELPHVLGVDPEVGLQRNLDLDTLGDVDEGPTRPDGAVQGRQLVVTRWDDRAEVLLEEVRVVPQRAVGVGEDHALRLQFLVQGVIDNL